MVRRHIVLVTLVIPALACGRVSFERPETMDAATDGGRLDGDAGDLDAGASDAGMDAGMDAATDGGPDDDAGGTLDADAPDASLACGLTCPGVPCDVRRRCATTCACNSEGCDLDCVPGSDCDPTCNDSCCTVDGRRASNLTVSCSNGSGCVVWASDTSNTIVTCDATSSCEVDCSGASNCTVDCPGGSCLVDCTGVSAGNCVLRGCSSTSCPGDVRVCGRGCP